MANTLNFRAVIQTKLSGYCTKTYYRKSKTAQTGTWIVYFLEDFMSSENVEQVKLEVHLMSDADNTTAIETLSDNIWNGLDHWDYMDSNIAFSCYQSVINTIEGDDPEQHKRLVFTIRLFK